jgi:site-specific recombinase XerD
VPLVGHASSGARPVPASTNDLRGARDKALLSLAYDTLCRRSEVVSLDVSDVINKDGQIKIYLKKSKTDQDGLGKLISINNETKIHLLKWVKKSKIISGKLFRGIKNNNEISTYLNKAQINKIFKKLALKANVDKEIIKKISAHSTRVGAAQNLLRSGASLATILNKGRWTKIDTAMRYLEFCSENIESI